MIVPRRFPMFLALLATAVLGMAAEPAPAHVFTDHAVLQAGRPVPVWGTADPGAVVTVRFATHQAEATTGATGRWQVTLPALAVSSEGRDLTIGTRVVHDVVVGEVWLCSGQSNMEMPVGPVPADKPSYRGITNWEQELADADLPGVRILSVTHAGAERPLPDLPMAWWRADATSARWTSAVAFTFARARHRAAGVPVGIIVAAWGGSEIQRWTPRSCYLGEAALPEERTQVQRREAAIAAADPAAVARWQAEVRAFADQTPPPPSAAWMDRPNLAGFPAPPGRAPGVLYNGMIAPLVPMALAGVLWYQGESNLGDGLHYVDRLLTLVTAWRSAFQRDDLPFLLVQLAPYDYKPGWPVKNPTPETLPTFWRAQEEAVRRIPGLALIPTNDVGEAEDIHPRNKRPIGERLAAAAGTPAQ